ncbi:FAD-dependent monooxygenase [Novosphingobium sp.]|uniref:FAD-dependent monooxygenase n=1 Tax=Novosphingobium sp. TaxID=1874826 RepID=UPI0025F24D2D|nr:FAD-dependent monooxygenase [Novosphingobium sp.]
MSDARILIVGAGIGGLVAALALVQRGFEVEVHEAASVLGEVGAGLTLSRGSQHVFRALGLMDAIAPFACPAAGFAFLHYRTGAVLAGQLDFASGGPDDGQADIGRQIHRADLHRVLAQALTERAPGALHLASRLTGIEETANGVRACFAGGAIATGDALIGADGVRSIARECLFGEQAPRYTGQIAYRFLVGRDAARACMGLGRGGVFLGPGRTFNRYTLRGGDVVNCVGIARHQGWTDDGWSTPADPAEVFDAFAGWHPDVIGLIRQAQSLIKWGLFDRAPMPQWSQGHATLLGDAAHPMLPFLGMGAAMAIEDGMILARAFAAEAGVEPAFARYEASRKQRTALVHAKSVEQGELTQARDPENYDASSAPASDPAIVAYDPVATPI